MTISKWPKQLKDGLIDMKITVTAEQQDKLIAYLTLLLKWNKAYNLTAIRNESEMVSRQLLDSLSVLSLVKGDRVLDVGSGAGLPGIPLAILMPDTDFVLLDTNSKKTRFLNQVLIELRLKNVEVEQQRVESYQPKELFDCITSRAFASLIDMIDGSKHLLTSKGQWLAMKANQIEEEIQALPEILNSTVHELLVPNEEANRVAVIIENA